MSKLNLTQDPLGIFTYPYCSARLISWGGGGSTPPGAKDCMPGSQGGMQGYFQEVPSFGDNINEIDAFLLQSIIPDIVMDVQTARRDRFPLQTPSSAANPLLCKALSDSSTLRTGEQKKVQINIKKRADKITCRHPGVSLNARHLQVYGTYLVLVTAP